MKIGDIVKYNKNFLRSIGEYSGDMCFAQGEILEINGNKDFQIARIKWNKPDIPESVNIKNLVLKNKIHLESY